MCGENNKYHSCAKLRGVVLAGYVVPGCVDDGACMLRQNSSVAVAVALLKLLDFLEITGLS